MVGGLIQRMPNAMEFSCGVSFPYLTKLFHRAVSYNSSLGGASHVLFLTLRKLDPIPQPL